MLDENLPTYFIRSSSNGLKHEEALYLSQYGSDPQPAYLLRHPDPTSQSAKNRYAAALFDSYNPEVLFAEVLVQPEWTQPSLSQDEIHRNGGVPPPPQPLVPSQFTIQLYNPDQQVTVVRKHGLLAASYEFTMPQNTFRTPSASALDRSQSDPAVAATTPHLNFVWKKESKLSKDLTCYLTDKSNMRGDKRKGKDPDIVVALFRSLREVTIYEPNLSRVEMEDLKGLELALILGAAVIRDIYLAPSKNAFHVADPHRRDVAQGSERVPQSLVEQPASKVALADSKSSPNAGVSARIGPSSPFSLSGRRPGPANSHLPPLTNSRTEWEIDAETARLKAQVEAEERQRRRENEARKREQQRADGAEARRLQKMVEDEERGRRRKQAEVDQETERLRRFYGSQQTFSRPPGPSQSQRPPLHSPCQYVSPMGPYLQVPGGQYGAASTTALSRPSPARSEVGHTLKGGKKSIWSLRRHSDESSSKLTRKASSMF